MQETRKKQIQRLLEEQLAHMFLLGRVRDPRVDTLLTVKGILVSGDLSYARVYIAHHLGKEKGQEIARVLTGAKGFIQTYLSRKLSFRKMPQLSFIYDEAFEQDQRVQEILQRENRSIS